MSFGTSAAAGNTRNARRDEFLDLPGLGAMSGGRKRQAGWARRIYCATITECCPHWLSLYNRRMGQQTRIRLLATAYHEAGHAVADWRHGFKVKRATVVPKNDALGSVSSVSRLHFRTLEYTNPSGARIGRYHEMIVSLLAGRAAQRRFKPQSIRSCQASSDLRGVMEILTRLHGYDDEQKHAFRYLEARARKLVSHPQNWRMIQDVAKALIERRTMTGDEVVATLRASMDAQYLKQKPATH